MRLPLIDRRRLLAFGAALPFLGACSAAPAEAKSFPKGKTDAQWRKLLSRDQFYVLREAGTERAFTSPLDREKRKGTFVCAGCINSTAAPDGPVSGRRSTRARSVRPPTT
jgi:peptide-methionine (R)-S-oxide reductase